MRTTPNGLRSTVKEWPPSQSGLPRRANRFPRRMRGAAFLQKAHRVQERQNFRGHLLRDGATAERGGGARETGGLLREQGAERADQFRPGPRGTLRPSGLRLARRGDGGAHFFCHRIEHLLRVQERNHITAGMGSRCSCGGVGSGEGTPRSSRSKREVMRADSKITGSPLPG